MTIRVLQVFKTYLPESVGGIEKAINSIARSVVAHGVETTVFSLGFQSGVDVVDGHKSVRARRLASVASTGFSLEAFSVFRLLAADADIVHFQFPWPFMDLLHFVSRHGKPTVVSYQSDIIRQSILKIGYAPLMKQFLSSADRIVVTSPQLAQTSQALQPFRNKIDIIPIGLDEALYPTPTHQLQISWARRLPQRFFLFVGVLRYYKGLHVLIEAAARTNIAVVIAGEGPMGNSLRSKVTATGSENILFVGDVSEEDKVALLKLCDGFIFPSHLRSEAYGIALLEAAMMGKPLISCEIGTGTSFINVNEVTGLVVEPDNSEALAGAMQRMWANRAASAEWGRAARARYIEKFTADSMGIGFGRLYSSLLKRA